MRELGELHGDDARIKALEMEHDVHDEPPADAKDAAHIRAACVTDPARQRVAGGEDAIARVLARKVRDRAGRRP